MNVPEQQLTFYQRNRESRLFEAKERYRIIRESMGFTVKSRVKLTQEEMISRFENAKKMNKIWYLKNKAKKAEAKAAKADKSDESDEADEADITA